jgi:hypothetical protein
MEQTAVEWLINQMVQSTTMKGWIEIFDKAKEMEKKQQDDYSIKFSEWLIENKILSSKMPLKELLEMFKNK